MKNKFIFLTKMSLLKKIKNKTFIIANIILIILLIGITNIDKIVTFFGGDFNETNNIMVVDNTNESYDVLKESMDNAKLIIDTSIKYKIKKVDNEKTLRSKIKKDKDIGIIINNDDENIIDAKIITYGYINTNLYQLLQSSINTSKQLIAINKLNIEQEKLAKISQSVIIKREFIQKNKNQEEETTNMIMGIVTPIIILPFFFLIMLIIQMIGAEINEEKSTKSMEIIISNVSAKVHFFSKVVAANLFVLIQTLLIVLYGFIGILLRGNNGMNGLSKIENISDIISSASNLGILDKVVNYLPIVIVLMLITLLGYSLLAGILASMTTNMEDFQQLQTPIIVISMVGFYLSLMSSLFEGSLFIRIFSYIPFISAILSPSLLITGVIGMKDIILSILLMIVVIYLLIKYGLKIYKEGILNYSGNKLWKKMRKALKN